MHRYSLLLLPFTLATWIARGQVSDTAHLFGKDVISTGDFTFNASFTPDGQTVFFSKATVNWGYIAIYGSSMERGAWSAPWPAPFTGVYRDTDPFVSADGSRLYFASDRPVVGGPYTDYDYHLFYVPLKGAKPDAAPVPLALPLAPGMKTLYPSFAANGNLYFCSSDTVHHDVDIYCSVFKEGAYQTPTALSFNDPKIVDFDPVVARDESFIIFTSTGRKGFGGVDLFVSFRTGDTWTEPVNLGASVNTAGTDGAPGLSPDNKTLYFCSYREPSPRKVYKNGKVSAPELDALFHSPGNGMRQIYSIDLSALISRLQAK